MVAEATMETFPNPTITRCRGRLTVWTDPSSTPGGIGFVSSGLIVVNAFAFAAGVAALPSPAVEIGSDWLWWDSLAFGAFASDVIGESITHRTIVVDSKAMRKVGPNQLLVLVSEMIPCEGTLVVNLCGFIRVLLKAS